MQNNMQNSDGARDLESALPFPKFPFRGYGGVTLPHLKQTMLCESVEMPVPKKVVISMQQHVGAPCTPTVKPGDEVKVGQIVGDSDKYVSAPVHASVSGTVTEITKLLLPSGQWAEAVVIESDGKQTLYEGLKPPKVDTIEELCAAVRAAGLVGLGGAGFPAHVKLSVPKDKTVDTLIINGAECEPFLTADYREMVEHPDDIFDGIELVKKLLGVHRVIIGVESNKPEAIKILTEIAARDDEVEVLKLRAQYPQGAEKVIIRSCVGRRVPKGKLPADVGCVVMNITSVSFVSRYVKTGIPLVSKRLTVDGTAIAVPKNVVAPIGTPFSDVIEFCGGYIAEPRKILMGGPMMGTAVFSADAPVLKQNNGLLVLARSAVNEADSTECIRCGRCVAACPMHLQPITIENKVKQRDIEALEHFSVMSCMECGSCAFVCPARRKLTQYMRMGKSLIRQAAAKK